MTGQSTPRTGQLRLWILRAYRAVLLIIVVVVIHAQARWFEAQRPAPVSLRKAQKYFSDAHRVQLRDAERGLYVVTDSRGNTKGALLTTAPQTDHIIGYSGPNNLLVVLDDRGAIRGIELLHSGDTEEHVKKVKADTNFFRSFLNWKPSEDPPLDLAGVSGATLTSFAIIEGIQQRLVGAAPSLRFPDPITIEEVQVMFTNAVRLVAERARFQVLDASGKLLGFAVRTSPQADNMRGYRGPTECLVALAANGRTVIDIRIRRSYDTDSYVDQIRRAEAFLKLFLGRSIEELAAFEYPKERIDGVSGATLTAQAVAGGVQRRSAAELKAQTASNGWRAKPRDYALAAVIVIGVGLSLSPWRGNWWVRIGWQLVLVGYVGLVNHDLLSVALFGGWAANGIALQAAPGLVLLGAAALIVPWTTRRQVYCHQICPHGAAQQLLGRLSRKKWSVPAGWTRALEFIPGLLLGLALLSLVVGLNIDLAKLEPFDGWVWRHASAGMLIFAAAGLVLSVFVPQAYCRFGCATGALLNFMRSAGAADRWSRRDLAALILVLTALLAAVGVRVWPRSEPEPVPASFTGRTMGTSWTVKIHDEIANPASFEKEIVSELEVAEKLTSHWRTNTDLSIFNATETTDPMPVPWPVLTLARWSAEISAASEGAFDVTIGSLVRLWGFGPGPRRTEPPSEEEIAAARASVGWRKLELLDGMLRKEDPKLQVDLSSIAKGWAIDQVAKLLDLRGYTNYLVEAGGELRARGGWKIAIEHPTRTCVLTNEAIATSGTYRQNFRTGERQYSHLIDPRTGYPVTHNTVSVSVRHAECARADAWATALNVLGFEQGLPLAEKLDIAAEFVVERRPGKFEVQASSAWKKKSQSQGRDGSGKILP